MIKQHSRIKMAPLAAAITAALGLTPLVYAQDDEAVSYTHLTLPTTPYV